MLSIIVSTKALMETSLQRDQEPTDVHLSNTHVLQLDHIELNGKIQPELYWTCLKKEHFHKFVLN